MHNLIVYKKEGQNYKISDPVLEYSVESDVASLQKARFAKGIMAPKGLLYYPLFVPKKIDYETVIPKSILKTAKVMLKTPLPFIGIRGMRYLAKYIRKLEAKDPRYTKLFLGHVIRMQEEIGTGGAGFRYIYAAYLDEASILLDNSTLSKASAMMTDVGDQWREFALMIAKAIRLKKDEPIDYSALAIKLKTVAENEAEVYRKLQKAF